MILCRTCVRHFAGAYVGKIDEQIEAYSEEDHKMLLFALEFLRRIKKTEDEAVECVQLKYIVESNLQDLNMQTLMHKAVKANPYPYFEVATVEIEDIAEGFNNKICWTSRHDQSIVTIRNGCKCKGLRWQYTITL